MAWHKHWNLFREATLALLHHRARSGVVFLALLAVLLPLIAALAVAEGVREQAAVSLAAGADLYVVSDQYGKNGPVSLDLARQIAALPGVLRVRPRIVGRTWVGDELVVVIGLDTDSAEAGGRPADHLQRQGSIPLPAIRSLDGSGEAMLGHRLADRLDLSPGDELRLPLFPALGLKINGIIPPEVAIWAGNMVVVSFRDAEQLFKLPGLASELLVYCRPGTADSVARQAALLIPPWDDRPPLRLQTKKIAAHYVEHGFARQAGIFVSHYLTAFGIAIPALLLLSGLGRGERRREIAIMKATGWQTLEVLEMTVMENLVLTASAGLAALLLAALWLGPGNGAGIAPLFIGGSDWLPDFPVPARFTPMPALMVFLGGLILTLTGTLIPTWRAAVIPPRTTLA